MFQKSVVRKITGVIACCSTVLVLSASNVWADGNQVNFSLTDIPGRWFDTGTAVAGSRSIAIVSPVRESISREIPIPCIPEPV